VTVVALTGERRCESCGAELDGGSSGRRYCSAKCRQAAFRRRRRDRDVAEARRVFGAVEPSALEQLLDVERLVTVLARHAYGGHPTSWRSALVLLERLYPNRWDARS
jgi:hypothetical protein